MKFNFGTTSRFLNYQSKTLYRFICFVKEKQDGFRAVRPGLQIQATVLKKQVDFFF